MYYKEQISVGTRFFARVIDSIIFVIIELIGGFILELIIKDSYFYWMSFTYILYLVYNIIMTMNFGQTIGKKVCRIKVRNYTKSKLGFIQVVFREMIVFFLLYSSQIFRVCIEDFNISFLSAYLIMVIIVKYILLLIDLSTICINDESRLLHDIIFKTLVIQDK